MNESIPPPPLTINDALKWIANIEKQVQDMGGNDREFGDFQRIRNELESGKITPEQAVNHSLEIQSGKQDYH